MFFLKKNLSGNCRCLATVYKCFFTQHSLNLFLTLIHPHLFWFVLPLTLIPTCVLVWNVFTVLFWKCRLTCTNISSSTVHLYLVEWKWSWSEWISLSATVVCFITQTSFLLPPLLLPPVFLLFLLSHSPTRLFSERMLWKKSTLAHLHAARLPSSCEWGIEMEMGEGRKSRLRSSNTCTASWLAHQLRRKSNMGRLVGGWWEQRGEM